MHNLRLMFCSQYELFCDVQQLVARKWRFPCFLSACVVCESVENTVDAVSRWRESVPLTFEGAQCDSQKAKYHDVSFFVPHALYVCSRLFALLLQSRALIAFMT